MARILGKPYPNVRVATVYGTPKEMGIQHGKQLADMIRKKLETPDTARIVAIHKHLTPAELDQLLEEHRSITTRIRPELFDEMHGIAEGAGVDFNKLLNAFLSRELPYGFPDPEGPIVAKEECTAFAASGNALLAQNRDSGYNGGEGRIVIVAKPSGANSFVVTGSVGSNDGYGVNSKGLAITSPAVRAKDSVIACRQGKPPGIQSFTLARMILESCSTVNEAVELIKKTPPGYMGLNWTIADANHQIARIERSYSKVNVTFPEEISNEKVIGATNHYLSEEMKDLAEHWPSPSFYLSPSLGQSTEKRFERITSLLTSTAGRIDFNTFQQFARDHANGPSELSICNHDANYGTNMSMIAQCKQLKLWVARGSPCLNEYMPYHCPD